MFSHLGIRRLCKETFLNFTLIILGSFHSAMKSSQLIWRETAKKLFNHTNDDHFVKRKGTYDKVIIDCAFRENLQRKKTPEPEGGCNGFHPSLTTNGICYTFNGKNISDLWKDSEMISTFAKVFPQLTNNNKTFGGSRTVQGNFR